MKVTILTVVFNGAPTLARTMQSVLDQTYPDIEYILLDGQSTDDSLAIANSFADRFAASGKTLRIYSERDGGMYDALNKGAALATGDLVGQINSDDWYEPNAVSEMVALYEKEAFDFAWSDLTIKRGTKSDLVKHAKVGKPFSTAGFCHPTMFSKRETLLAFPYACRQIDDDFDMIARAFRAGKVIRTLNKPLANYSIGGMSTKKSLKKTCYRIGMKYGTYRRNGYSPFIWFYCFGVEFAKLILG